MKRGPILITLLALVLALLPGMPMAAAAASKGALPDQIGLLPDVAKALPAVDQRVPAPPADPSDDTATLTDSHPVSGPDLVLSQDRAARACRHSTLFQCPPARGPPAAAS